MPKSKTAAAPEKFSLLAEARGHGWNRQCRWIERLPDDLRQEISETCATLATEPIGSVSFIALARALMKECDRRELPHPKEQAISKHFSDAIQGLRNNGS